MELIKKENRPTFPVAYDDHTTILEHCELLHGQLEVLLYAFQGMLDAHEGAQGHLRALCDIASKAQDIFYEMEEFVTKLNKEKGGLNG